MRSIAAVLKLTMATAAVGKEAISVVLRCLEIIDKILELLNCAKENDEYCRHILGQLEIIKSILSDLKKNASH